MADIKLLTTDARSRLRDWLTGLNEGRKRGSTRGIISASQ